MAEDVFLIVGGIMIGIIVFTLAYRFFIITSHNSLKTLSINEFDKFYSSIDLACSQERKSLINARVPMPDFVRAVYASDDDKPIPKVTENIKNGKISYGSYVCMQFKTEQQPRCKQVSCKVFMPFVGSLEAWNDLKLLVNKILGKPMIKEYSFNISKTSYGVDITYDDYKPFKSPVVSIAYIPLINGKVDTSKTGDWKNENKDDLEQSIIEHSQSLAEFLTHGTRYKWYINPESIPNINFYLAKTKVFYDDVPKKGHLVDLEKVLDDIDVCKLADDGVKEFWLWVYNDNRYKPIEFSTVMGYKIKDHWNFDKNSDGEKDYGLISKETVLDLPVCANSYTIHTFIITDNKGVVLGNYTHSLEEMFEYADENAWVAFNSSCGTTDCPPNLEWPDCLYNWDSDIFKESDCMNWNPDGGVYQQINCHAWYGNRCKNDDGLEYKVWWMQNIPGRNNGLKLSDGRKVKNWWAFVADFDNAVKDKRLIE